jgi:hypothetical protein
MTNTKFLGSEPVCLSDIENAMEASIASWLVYLHYIRAESLWEQDTGEQYQSFQDYASRRWSVGRRRADQWASAGEILLDLYPELSVSDQGTAGSLSGLTGITVNERILRPLVALKRSGYSTQDIRDVWKNVLEGHSKPTSKYVADEATIFKAQSLSHPSGEPGPDFIREMIVRDVYDIVRRDGGSDRLATFVRAGVLDLLLDWAKSSGKIYEEEPLAALLT